MSIHKCDLYGLHERSEESIPQSLTVSLQLQYRKIGAVLDRANLSEIPRLVLCKIYNIRFASWELWGVSWAKIEHKQTIIAIIFGTQMRTCTYCPSNPEAFIRLSGDIQKHLFSNNYLQAFLFSVVMGEAWTRGFFFLRVRHPRHAGRQLEGVVPPSCSEMRWCITSKGFSWQYAHFHW